MVVLRYPKSFLLVLFVALLPEAHSVQGYYTGACIKMPTTNKKAMQYHMRIPEGKRFHSYDELFPGEFIYNHLEECRVRNFTTIYDIDGNAHVDFAVNAKKFKFLKNTCDVAKHITVSTLGSYVPECVDGTPEKLADLWRKSWVNH